MRPLIVGLVLLGAGLFGLTDPAVAQTSEAPFQQEGGSTDNDRTASDRDVETPEIEVVVAPVPAPRATRSRRGLVEVSRKRFSIPWQTGVYQ